MPPADRADRLARRHMITDPDRGRDGFVLGTQPVTVIEHEDAPTGDGARELHDAGAGGEHPARATGIEVRAEMTRAVRIDGRRERPHDDQCRDRRAEHHRPRASGRNRCRAERRSGATRRTRDNGADQREHRRHDAADQCKAHDEQPDGRAPDRGS